jgi:ABC-type transport system involved in multi-copper enzyme maturation permease subunit
MTSNRQTLAEAAPSQLREDVPVVARWLGMFGWSAVFLGIGAVCLVLYGRAVVSEEVGWFVALIGIVLALLHAAMETDGMIRRYTAIAGVVGIAGGLIWGIAYASQGKNWGVALVPFFPGTFFVALFARQETDEFWRNMALYLLAAIGGIGVVVGSVMIGLAKPWSENLGYVLFLISSMALPLFFGLSQSGSKQTYYAGLALVVFGLLLLAITTLRAVIPDLMHEWRSPVPKYALPTALVGVTLLVLGLLAWLVLPKQLQGTASFSPEMSKSVGRIGVMSGTAMAVIGIARLLATDMLRNSGWFKTPAEQFLIPNGVTLGVAATALLFIGLMYYSENRLIVMIRREFSSFWVSPIAYLVLIGYTAIGAGSYLWFLLNMIHRSVRGQPFEEPFVAQFFLNFVPVVAVVFGVPFLTMRLLSEERRTATLEVLLTSPVAEWQVILSKFVACWLFFMLLWAPWFSFLLALRLETGKPFDYHPLVGFVVALGVSGANFVALGLLFSSLSRNQIIAAVLTFMSLMMYILVYFGSGVIQTETGWVAQLKELFRVVNFIDMWMETWNGKLWLRDVVFQLSATVFWLFLGVKVLESRRWT